MIPRFTRQIMKPIALSALISCFFSLSAASRAAVVIDNLSLGNQSSSQSLSGPTATGFFGLQPFANREVAFSFTTGSQDTFLTELMFGIAIGKQILNPIQITLSTGSSVPGGINPITVGSVTPPSSTPTSQILTLVPSPTILLDANTLYWMHVTVPSGAAVYSFVNTNNVSTASGWTLGNSWSRSPGNPWSELDTGPQANIRMTVQPVPEPGACLLGGAGFLLLLRRRRA